MREVGRWTWLPADQRADVLHQYQERRERLLGRATMPTPAQPAPLLAPPPDNPAPSDVPISPEKPGGVAHAAPTSVPPSAPWVVEEGASLTPRPPTKRPAEKGAVAQEWENASRSLHPQPAASSSEAREALDAAQSFLQQQNIRWFHALGALLLVVAGIGYLRANWDTVGSIVVTLGLLLLPGASFWGSHRLRATLPDSSRGLAILGSVTLPAGLLALQLFGFVAVAYADWAFGVFTLTTGVLAGIATLLSEPACVYLSAISTTLAAWQLTSMVPGTFGYPLLAFAFIGSTWAARGRADDLVAIHASSVAQLMARIALLATFGNGIDPGIHHLAVGLLVSAWFVYGAVLSPSPSNVLHAVVGCGLSWLMVYLRSVAGLPTPEGLVECVLAPMAAVLALAAHQTSARINRQAALPIARTALLLGGVVLGVTPFASQQGASSLMLMACIEIAALSTLFRGWPLLGWDAAQTLFAVAAATAPLAVARMVATLSELSTVTWMFLAESLCLLVVAQLVDRLRGRVHAQFLAQLALLLGTGTIMLMGVLLVANQPSNLAACMIVVTVAATAFEPFYRGWSMRADVFPMDAIAEEEHPHRRHHTRPVVGDITSPEGCFSMSFLLGRVAALIAPLTAAQVTMVFGPALGLIDPTTPLAAAATVTLVEGGLACMLGEGGDRDVHWRDAMRFASMIGALWTGGLAVLSGGWMPGLHPISFTAGAAATVFAVQACLLGQPSVAHLAYLLAHVLLLANVPRPPALEWYTFPLGLWIVAWTRRAGADHERGELAGLLVMGGPSLLASFETAPGLHLACVLGAGVVAMAAGLRGRRRTLIACSAALLVGAAFEESLRLDDYSILFGVATVLAAFIEPAFRDPLPSSRGAGAEGVDPLPEWGRDSSESRGLAYAAALLAPACVASRLFAHGLAQSPPPEPLRWGLAALGGAVGAVALLALSTFARDSNERDVHWRSALDDGSLLTATWAGGLGVANATPGLNAALVAVGMAVAVLAVHAVRPPRVAVAHFAFGYVFSLFLLNSPHPLHVEWVTFPLAAWLFFSAYRLHASTALASFETAACMVFGVPSLVASMGPDWGMHAVACGLAGVVLFTGGSLRDRAIPTLTGAFLLGAEGLYRMHHVLVSMPWQLYATVAGLFLIGMGVLIERRRTWLLAYGDKIRRQWTYREGVLSAPRLASSPTAHCATSPSASAPVSTTPSGEEGSTSQTS